MNHLDGVRVLSEEVVKEMTIEGILFGVFSLCIATFIGMVVSDIFNKLAGYLLLFVASIIIICTVMFLKPINNIAFTEYKQYDIILEKSVDYKKFSDTYNVISHSGEIYIVRFKNNSNIID